jgi:AAA15 family ATPase/GTPase
MVEFINYNTNLYLEEINQEYIQGFQDLYEALKEELETDIKNFAEIEDRKIQKLIQHEQPSFDPTTLLQ